MLEPFKKLPYLKFNMHAILQQAYVVKSGDDPNIDSLLI